MNGDAAYLYDFFDKKRCKQLYFSTVFYLKTDDLEQLKKDARNMEINGVPIPNSRMMNLAQIKPPITDDKVIYQLLLINDEEELKVVKEFTKTKTFDYIKNM